MTAKSLFIAFFFTSLPVFADTLLMRSVYFDSMQTLNEVVELSAQHDNEGIAKLIHSGHILAIPDRAGSHGTRLKRAVSVHFTAHLLRLRSEAPFRPYISYPQVYEGATPYPSLRLCIAGLNCIHGGVPRYCP